MYRQGMTFLPTGAGLQEPGPGSDPEGEKPLEKPPENPPENQLEISYTVEPACKVYVLSKEI